MPIARRLAMGLVGVAIAPAVWALVKASGAVSDRMLPSPLAVITAAYDIEPSILVHLASTASRLFVGFVLGTVLGLSVGIVISQARTVAALTLPTLHAIRAIPAAAAVPFFLLWFGFSEWGRVLLVVVTVAANVAVAGAQIMAATPEKYSVMLLGFSVNRYRLLCAYALPWVLSRILPTLRFALALVVGAQAVSELLGAQVGLGYVIQSARSTFSLPVLFLAVLLLGLVTAIADYFLCAAWRRIVFWEQGARS